MALVPAPHPTLRRRPLTHLQPVNDRSVTVPIDSIKASARVGN